MAEVTLQVEGMSCNHCKMSVERALKNLDGVTAATVDLGARTAHVTYDSSRVDIEAMKKAISDAGYEVK
ncbi:copper ion-binding protein [Moorella thermoacetica]|uniref:Copper chaperone CopZ n=1 Tax=Neomoorella thermoacetica TaxID=1525 RepID=A0A1D7XEV0_NEOTH|nr:copper chaperone CopZ [Moorella thermoacetica]MDN5325430.1 copper chaperone [Moorella sp. (in: firmicutes)]AKX95278.1 copper chaperone CopZ [Moorella thermoacetica]AKX97903.1 copper chaperone CopZ [Moorella thermoacetica]AOQ25392.1 Copper chaperone CopZ [Moorella thermoacetica]APC09616.1 copper chaperone CopZ [Moorella thermoacetica]